MRTCRTAKCHRFVTTVLLGLEVVVLIPIQIQDHHRIMKVIPGLKILMIIDIDCSHVAKGGEKMLGWMMFCIILDQFFLDD